MFFFVFLVREIGAFCIRACLDDMLFENHFGR